MEHKSIPVELLTGHSRNYRSHPAEQLVKLVASLERFQQVRSIVVAPESNGRYTILAGHGVVEAAEKCGLLELNCDIVPREWDQATRTAYLVADNLHAQGAVDDEELLSQLLNEQYEAGYDLASMGGDDEMLRQMLADSGENDEHEGYESEGDDDDDPSQAGKLLALLDVTIADPRHVVASGDIWRMGPHTLIIVHVFKDWRIWTNYLKDEKCLFLPFAGPMVALSDAADQYMMVLVQPDTYIAGHVLDRYADIHGEKSVRKIEKVEASTSDEMEDYFNEDERV